MATTKKTSTKSTRSKSAATTRKTRSTAPKTTSARTAAPKTTARSTAAKPTTPSTIAKVTAVTAAKPKAPATAAPATTAVAPTAAPAVVTKKALFERVKAQASEVKGRDVRAVLDAVLQELGGALSAGETVKIPPMGVLKVQRRRDIPDGEIVVCRLRRRKASPTPKDPLAEAAE